MSYRPTVTVYYDGRCIACTYCRNYLEKGLVKVAVFYAAYLDTCRSEKEVRHRLFGRPDAWPDAGYDEASRDLESWSDKPVLVDLTARCIYVSAGALSSREVSRLREIDLTRASKLFDDDDPLLREGTRISFETMDLNAVRRLPYYRAYCRALWGAEE